MASARDATSKEARARMRAIEEAHDAVNPARRAREEVQLADLLCAARDAHLRTLQAQRSAEMLNKSAQETCDKLREVCNEMQSLVEAADKFAPPWAWVKAKIMQKLQRL